MGETIGLQSHTCLVMGETLGLIQLNARVTQGLGTWIGGLAPTGLEAPMRGIVCCISIDSISLRLPRKLNHITLASRHMFT